MMASGPGAIHQAPAIAPRAENPRLTSNEMLPGDEATPAKVPAR